MPLAVAHNAASRMEKPSLMLLSCSQRLHECLQCFSAICMKLLVLIGQIDGPLGQSNKSEGSLAFLPSTQAGFAFVVPATCPLRQAHRAVCRAIILLGWLISLSRAVISHVPTSSSFPMGRHWDRTQI